MDIISHSLTGLAIGTVCAHFSSSTWSKKCMILFTSTLGGALPDLDAISLWSGFDSTLGDLLNLEATGRQIYYGQYWYSHHAALHSLIAPFVIIILAMLLTRIYSKITRIPPHSVSNNLHIKLGFALAFIFHLLEDMPTPAGVWGGVNLFFPSSQYIGGFGKIWWWNNYDLILIILSVVIINLFLFLIPRRYGQLRSRLSLGILCMGIYFYLVQINSRPFNFNYSGRLSKAQNFESQSLTIQREMRPLPTFHHTPLLPNTHFKHRY